MTTLPLGVVPDFTICDRLRKARELTGLDQSPFADDLGVSRGTVSNYERDETAAFKPIVLRAWSLRTGVPLEWLQTGITPGTDDGPEGEGLPRLDSNQQPAGNLFSLVSGGVGSEEVAA